MPIRSPHSLAIASALATVTLAAPLAATSVASVPPLECAEAVRLSATVEPLHDPLFEQVLTAALRAGLQERRIAFAAGLARAPEVAVNLRLDPRGGAELEISVEDDRGDGASSAEDGDATPWLVDEAIETPIGSTRPLDDDLRAAVGRALGAIFGAPGRCQPRRVASRSGTFALELPPENDRAAHRFSQALARERRLDIDDAEATATWSLGSLIEILPSGREVLRATPRFPDPPHGALVADDGRFVALPFAGSLAPSDVEKVALYGMQGERVRTLALDDLLTPSDRRMLTRLGGRFAPPSLDDQDRLLVSTRDGDRTIEFRIDLDTGLTDEPPRDRLPHFGVEGNVYSNQATFRSGWRPPICRRSGAPADFADPAIEREPPAAFFARARIAPLPVYPEIAERARLQATLAIEAIVDADGRVVCARVTDAPMGLPSAIEAVVLGWRFEPIRRPDAAKRTVGLLAVRFALLDPPP